MQAITMNTLALSEPYPGVVRMTSRLGGVSDTDAWSRANVAIGVVIRDALISRDYTVRRFDPVDAEIDIDFVWAVQPKPVRAWLGTVGVGSRTTIVGPRRHPLPNFGDGRRVLLFGDDTALPAVHSILDRWPSDTLGTLWIETSHPAAIAELPTAPGANIVTFLHGVGDVDALVSVARSRVVTPEITVWAAGELHRMSAIRDHFHGSGLADDHIRVFDNWVDVTRVEAGIRGSD